MTELFISGRYVKSRRSLNFITIISLLSTLGITIGVAALIIVLSVFNGFGGLVKSILVNFDPHVRITLTDSESKNHLENLEAEIKKIKGVDVFTPYVEGKIVLFTKHGHYEIVDLKGIRTEKAEGWGVKERIVTGGFGAPGRKSPASLVSGFPVAIKLSSRKGDTLQAISFNKIEKTLVNYSLPGAKNVIISGIFETNNKEYDSRYVFCDLENGQDILGLGKDISGYELRLDDLEKADEVKETLSEKLDPGLFSVYSWYDLHSDLYNVMQIERWSAYILLCLIIAVGTFNILSSLSMTVIEKKKDIGILRSFGASEKFIRRIFLFEGMIVGVAGTLAGLAIGVLICYLQIEFNIYTLDNSRYIINALPVELRLSDIIVIAAMSLFLTFSASLYPARRALKISVTDAVKWE